MKKTGYFYDDTMCLHRKRDGQHPECPERITSIHKYLYEKGLLDKCVHFDSRLASEEEVLDIHTLTYLSKLKNLKSLNDEQLDKLQVRYNSIYLNNDSYDCALKSAGCVTELTKQVLIGTCHHGIAVVRPPGHHAESDEAMGFCLLNNVAIAANMARRKFKTKRIVILDWDIHHGNATQHQFYETNEVLYLSLHKYNHGKFYPGGKDGHSKKIGYGKGEGYNVNIAWNANHLDDNAYVLAFDSIIIPILESYKPELILISAGFDCADGDHLGDAHITPIGFQYMTHKLVSLMKNIGQDGKIVMALEGGYNLNSISISMAACLEVLTGYIPKEYNKSFFVLKEDDGVRNSLRETKDNLLKYWPILHNSVI